MDDTRFAAAFVGSATHFNVARYCGLLTMRTSGKMNVPVLVRGMNTSTLVVSYAPLGFAFVRGPEQP